MSTINSTQTERKITMDALRETIRASKEKLLLLREEELRLSLCDPSKGIECISVSSLHWDEDYMKTLDLYNNIDFSIEIYAEFIHKGDLKINGAVRYSNFNGNGSTNCWIEYLVSDKPIISERTGLVVKNSEKLSSETQTAMDECHNLLERGKYDF